MVKEVCSQYLFNSLREGNAIPEPTPLEAVEKDENTAIVNLICVNLNEYDCTCSDKVLILCSIVYF